MARKGHSAKVTFKLKLADREPGASAMKEGRKKLPYRRMIRPQGAVQVGTWGRDEVSGWQGRGQVQNPRLSSERSVGLFSGTVRVLE